jgi:hypothetical protein
MAHVMSFLRSFVMVALCLNPVLMVASEFRRSSEYSIPGSQSSYSSGKGSGKGFAVMGLLYLGKFNMLNGVHFPDIRTTIGAIDLSSVKTVVNDNKVMLGAAVGVMSLLLLTKRLKDSERFGPWCSENYVKVGNAVESSKKYYVEQLPGPVQAVIWPFEIALTGLYNLIKKYVGMNKTTIVSSISSPVAGKLLDCGFVCPIPLCSFTSIGWLSGGIILTKGYFDQSFEKIEIKVDDLATSNKQQHDNTQKQIKTLGKQGKTLKGELSTENKAHQKELLRVSEVHQKELVRVSEQHKNALSGQLQKGFGVIDNKLVENDNKNIQEHAKTRSMLESQQTELRSVKNQQILVESEKKRRRVEKEKERDEAEEKRQALEQKINNIETLQILAESEKKRRQVEKEQKKAELKRKSKEEEEALSQEINNIKKGQKELTVSVNVQNDKIDKLQEGVDELLSFAEQHGNSKRITQHHPEQNYPGTMVELKIQKYLNIQ